MCGGRYYSIVEASAQTFASIAPPAVGLNDLVDNWTLTFLSTNLADVGVWTVTLKAELQQYPTITPATTTVNVTVVAGCVSTSIQSQVMTPSDY